MRSKLPRISYKGVHPITGVSASYIYLNPITSKGPTSKDYHIVGYDFNT